MKQSVTNYKEQQRDYDQDNQATYATRPDESVDIVFSTTETGTSTAVAGIFNRTACAAAALMSIAVPPYGPTTTRLVDT